MDFLSSIKRAWSPKVGVVFTFGLLHGNPPFPNPVYGLAIGEWQVSSIGGGTLYHTVLKKKHE